MILKKVKKVILTLQKFKDVEKKQRTRILYEDEIDGLSEYESDSPTDEEQEENNNYEIQTKHKEKQPKQIKNQNNLRKVLQNQ